MEALAVSNENFTRRIPSTNTAPPDEYHHRTINLGICPENGSEPPGDPHNRLLQRPDALSLLLDYFTVVPRRMRSRPASSVLFADNWHRYAAGFIMSHLLESALRDLSASSG